ncbi:hypothetical protein Dimus_021753 [Dionaea muscipula]
MERNNIDSPGAVSPQTTSLLNRHARSSSSGVANMRKPQNMQTKAAAQRLAQVMSHQSNDDEDEEEDDFSLEYGSTGLGLAATGRSIRPRTPTSVRPAVEQPPPTRPTITGRPSLSVRTSDRTPAAVRSSQTVSSSTASEQPPSAHYPSMARSPLATNLQEQTSSLRSTVTINQPEQPPSLRTTLPINQPEQPPSARSTMLTNQPEQPPSGRSPRIPEQLLSGRSTLPPSSAEQPPSARSLAGGRPHMGTKLVPMVPPAVTISLKQQTPKSTAGVLGDNRKDKRLSMDWGSMNNRDPKETPVQLSSTALQDEVDMLQEENETLLEKDPVLPIPVVALVAAPRMEGVMG